MSSGSEVSLHLRHPGHLFEDGQLMELLECDDNEFDTLIEAVENIRDIHQRL